MDTPSDKIESAILNSNINITQAMKTNTSNLGPMDMKGRLVPGGIRGLGGGGEWGREQKTCERKS